MEADPAVLHNCPRARSRLRVGLGPPSPTEAHAEFEERSRKAELLASDRWRRAVFELDEWLAVQPVYTPGEVARIKTDLAKRIEAMSSYELDYLLDNLEFKLRVLDTPEATGAREWLGRYLSVMAERKRAELLADVPNVVDMSSGELIEGLRDLEARRAAVERRAVGHVRRHVHRSLLTASDGWKPGGESTKNRR